MSGKRAWNGDSEPFNGSEGNTFEEGNSSAMKHSADAEMGKLFDKMPELTDYKQERVAIYEDECRNPRLFESQIETLAQLDCRIRFVEQNLDADVDKINQTNAYSRLISERRKLMKNIDWANDEATGTRAQGFFEALSGDPEDDE